MSFKSRLVCRVWRLAPSLMRSLAYHYSSHRYRWPVLEAIVGDPKLILWLASLENPTKTRHSFRLYTIAGDLTSDWIKVYGQHEQGTEKFVLHYLARGSTFLDIGANIGYFSLLAAVEGGAKVVSFEPQSEVADLIKKSAALNDVGGSVRVEKLALSDVSATMRMTVCPGNNGHSQLTNSDQGNTALEEVSVVRLDDWVSEWSLEKVSVCKIDTEGAEVGVLRGMMHLLERDSPAIVIEVINEHLVSFGTSESELVDLIRSIGYRDVSDNFRGDGDMNRYYVRDIGGCVPDHP